MYIYKYKIPITVIEVICDFQLVVEVSRHSEYESYNHSNKKK